MYNWWFSPETARFACYICALYESGPETAAWTMANSYLLDAFKIFYIRLKKYKLTWRVLCSVNLLHIVIKEQNEI